MPRASLKATIIIDVIAEAAQLSTPCLIIHARNDQTDYFDEGRELATYVPDARFVPLDSNNHILLPTERHGHSSGSIFMPSLASPNRNIAPTCRQPQGCI